MLASLTLCAIAHGQPTLRRIHDEQGREIVPGGYVVITEDRRGAIRYTPDDYRRMVRLGANFQVIRLALGRLGGWPGKRADPAYPEQVDAMARMGRQVGLRTVFKLVVYDVRPFGNEQWEAIWSNTGGAQDALLAAWRTIWIRYKDDPSVFGYDLLNEPFRGLQPDYNRCCREQLLPTLRRLADAMHAVSPEKWALYQPLLRNREDRRPGINPYVPIREPFGRPRAIYAPHLYQPDPTRMAETLEAYMREAALSRTPLLIGEWGPATPLSADRNLRLQARFRRIYQTTASALDQRGIGGFKAWFCGSRAPLRGKRPEPITYAIFSDTSPVGHVERRYITDVLARPRPLAVAGRLIRYGYDFDTRTLQVRLEPDERLGPTEIFVSADRFYPDGFRLEVGPALVLVVEPGNAQPHVVRGAEGAWREQAHQIGWNPETSRLVIRRWCLPARELTLRITPRRPPPPPR